MAKRNEKFEQKQWAKQEERTNRIIEMKRAGDKEALDKYYKNHRSFLNYIWGVFVTAYARRELEDRLNIAGLDTIYCDTDSVKCIGDHDKEFEAYNERLNRECLQKGVVNYVEVNGKRYYIERLQGEYDYEEEKINGKKNREIRAEAEG